MIDLITIQESLASLREERSRNTLFNVLIVFPGLGRSDRLITVVNNVRLLVEQVRMESARRLKITCVIYIYTSRQDTEFWSHTKEIDYLSMHCVLIEHIGKRVTENIYLIQPVYLKNQYDYIFLLLDDCKIQQPSDFDILGMIQIMQCNHLSVLSPLVSISIPSFLLVSFLIMD